ncbi:MAG TPA: NosD domain-containing protein [Gammaproteobacteria bacterium]|nr:NosD domain-containing protein [Gammaproteobacteria bacterium]
MIKSRAFPMQFRRLISCLWLLLLAAAPALRAEVTQLTPRQYTITRTDGAELRLPQPILPDIAPYNESAARRRLDAVTPDAPVIEVRRVFGEFTLSDFTAAERAGEWAKRQSSFPRAIFLKSGLARPDDIADALAGSGYFVRDPKDPDIYTVRLPLVIEEGATLVLESDEELRLSQQSGSFMVVDGKMFAFGSRLIAWDEKAGKAALFRNKEEFRPFMVSWSGSELYLINSRVESFGYFMSKSYGITVSSYTRRVGERLKRDEGPKAWLIGSEFVDMYYGFYCYHAKDLALIGNTYRDNIVYGIDPHDYSSGIIIAHNTVFGTRKKHGIIISRGVGDSWIFNNRSFNNKLSGFAIDRNSTNNLLAYNESFHNGSDGLTIYESSDNLIWENFFYANAKHGVSARNSTDVRLYNNRIIANGSFGVYGKVADLSHTDRNIELDPYASEISLTVAGGVIAANNRGSLSIDRPLSLELYDIDLRFPSNSKGLYMEGALAAHHEQLMEILFKDRQAAILHPVDKQVQ